MASISSWLTPELTDFLPWQSARHARLTGQKVRSNDWPAPRSGANEKYHREPGLSAIRWSRWFGMVLFLRYQLYVFAAKFISQGAFPAWAAEAVLKPIFGDVDEIYEF